MTPRLLLNLQRYAILLAFVIIIVTLSVVSPSFRSPTNLLNLVRQTSIYGIMAVGMTFVILTSGIDLSVGSVLALTGLLFAFLEKCHFPVPLAIAATLLLGCVLGLVNGLTITLGKVTPFVVTLGTMSIFRGLALLATESQPISRFSPGFRFVGAGQVMFVPVPIILFLLSVGVAAVVLQRTRLGRYLYAIGGNLQAARLCGIPINWCTTAAYVACSLTAALSAVILTARLNAAEPIAGVGYELDVIASVVIGGTSLSGGYGSIWGTLLGVLLIGTIDNSMNLLEIPSYNQLVVKGTIIIGAALLDRLRVAAVGT